MQYKHFFSNEKLIILMFSIIIEAALSADSFIITLDVKETDPLSTQIEDMSQKESVAPTSDCKIIILSGKESDEIIRFISHHKISLTCKTKLHIV
jgi:hypothetical protein